MAGPGCGLTLKLNPGGPICRLSLTMTPTLRRWIAVLTLPAWLAGCDLLGIEPASAGAARKEAEGKAVGGACRHAGRAIEDCYALNKKADKAAVFAGWREMNDYMRENKIEAVAPQIAASGPAHGTGEGAADPGEAPASAPKAATAKGAKKAAK